MKADRPIRMLAVRAVRRVSFTLTILFDTKAERHFKYASKYLILISLKTYLV